MSLDIIALQCFIAVADSGSITKAAEIVGRTQSAVSQQILKLEHLFDTELLYRNKKLTLTTDGDIFLNYARKIYALQREAIDHFRQPELKGEIRFGLPEDFATVLLSGVLANFIHNHPLISLKVECDFTANLYDKFKNNDFDLVLVKMPRPEDFPNGVEVWSEDLVWVGAPGLIEGGDEYSVPLVLSPKPCVYRARAIESFEKYNKKWRIVYTSPSYAGIIAAVKAGIGITVMPRNMVPEDLTYIINSKLPDLQDIHVSLLTKSDSVSMVHSFAQEVLKHLQRV